MKRMTLNGTVAALAIAVVLSVGSPAARAQDVLSAITEKPAVIIRADGVMALARAIGQTEVGKQIAATPVLSGVVDAAHSGARLGGAFLADLPKETVDRLLGREIAAVVFWKQGFGMGPPPFAVALDLGGDAAMVRQAFSEVAIPRIQASNPMLTVGTSPTPGGETVVLDKHGQEVHVRFVGDLLVLGSPDGVDRFAPPGSTPAWLADTGATGTLAASYLDVSPLLDLLVGQAGPGQLAGIEASGVLALQDVRASMTVTEGGFRDTVVARMTPGELGVIQTAMELAPGSVGSAAVVPADYGFLLSAQIESGERLYGLIEDVVLQTAGQMQLDQFRMGMDQVDQLFAVNVEFELLPEIGNEVFVALRAPDEDLLRSGRGPEPKNLEPIFGFAIEDPSDLIDIVERFAASPQAAQMGWQLVNDRHGDQEFYTLDVGRGQVSFAFMGGYAVISHDVMAVRGAIEAVDSGQTLATDAAYRATMQHLPSAVSAAAYVNPQAFIEGILPTLKQNARRPRQQAFLPIAEGLAGALSGYGVALVADGDEIRLEGYGPVPAAFGLASVGFLGAAIDGQK